MLLCTDPSGEESALSVKGGGIADARPTLSYFANTQVGARTLVSGLIAPSSVGFLALVHGFFWLFDALSP